MALVWPAVLRTPPGSSAGRRAHDRLGPRAATGGPRGVSSAVRDRRPRRAGAQPGAVVLSRRAVLAAADPDRQVPSTLGIPRVCLGRISDDARHGPARIHPSRALGWWPLWAAWIPLLLLGLYQGAALVALQDARSLARIELTGRGCALVLGGSSLLVFGSNLGPFLAAVVTGNHSHRHFWEPSTCARCPRAGLRPSRGQQRSSAPP